VRLSEKSWTCRGGATPPPAAQEGATGLPAIKRGPTGRPPYARLYRFALPKRPRRWQHGAILTFALLFTLLGLAPLRGGDVELQIPVSYARVKLGARVPTLVTVDLPAGSYTVEPPSLGYFNNKSEFVYTADEPRGLIYSKSGEKVVVLELQSPARSEEFVKDYLQRIRSAVTNLNARKNELLQARQRFAMASARPKQLAAIPLGMNSLDLAQGFADWSARCGAEGQGMLTSALSALEGAASERNELKRLHYESEKADIELAVRSFDLQVALARLPRPKFASVLGKSDRTGVQANALRELEKRQQTYLQRHGELEQQQRMDMQWLSGNQVAQSLAALTAVPVMVPASSDLPYPLDTSLRESIQQTRLSLSSAESEYIDSALSAVTTAIAYVKAGGVLEGEELPRVTIERGQFANLRVSDLDDLAVVEASAIYPGPASNLLLELAQAFERPEDPKPLHLNNAGNTYKLDVIPREVGYGLLIVDRCKRVQPTSSGRSDVEDLAERLQSMLDKPAQHGAAENDLGYLEFMRWYARLATTPAAKLGEGIEASSELARPAH
jgi:hypothetical protein